MPVRAGGRRCTRRLLAVLAAATTAAATGSLRAEGRTHRVEMRDVAFVPAQLTVRAGDRVAWDNADIVAHTATSEEEGGFDVDLPPGGKGSTLMSRPGSFAYLCRYHPNMTGRIVVEP